MAIIKDKDIKTKQRIYVLFVLELDSEYYKFIKNKNILAITEICSWMSHWLDR